ncbi:CCNI protein, partial [Atractosteus spatula]|nr:CCNI protein [Atractosteus spatula]
MKCPTGSDECRLAILLEDALSRESRLWKAPVFKHSRSQGTDISPSQYEEVVLWLLELGTFFKFCPETFALAVCILNRMLASVKAQPKYLRCIAVTSLILAAKTNEEDEVIVSVKDLAVQSRCKCSPAEILRMERTILNKLHWDLYIATPVDFVNIFHAMALSSHPRLPGMLAQKIPSLQAELWTRQVQHCMACHQLSQFKGSTLALATITLELERLTPDWFSVFTDLLKKAQIDSTELIRCKELVDQYLSGLQFSLPPNTVYIFHPANRDALYCERSSPELCPAVLRKRATQPSLPGHVLCQFRKAQQHDGEVEADEFYDGFRCLYNEGIAVEVGGNDTVNPHEALQENGSPCPPLQPPVS